jgi:hypothetical protein
MVYIWCLSGTIINHTGIKIKFLCLFFENLFQVFSFFLGEWIEWILFHSLHFPSLHEVNSSSSEIQQSTLYDFNVFSMAEFRDRYNKKYTKNFDRTFFHVWNQILFFRSFRARTKEWDFRESPTKFELDPKKTYDTFWEIISEGGDWS